ncbi:MAG: hypothetical protein ACJ76U_15780 [Gaiellaceae bacterium]
MRDRARFSRKPSGRPFVAVAFIVALAVLLPVAASAVDAKSKGGASSSAVRKKTESPALHHDVSPPLRDIAPAPISGKLKKDKEPKHGPPAPEPGGPDPVVQSSPGVAAAPALGVGVEGLGQGFSGPSGTFSVDSAPPDPNGAVGPNHFVEVVNESLAVFNKSGGPVYGPVATNTLWSGFGGGCQSNDDGDATVAYDRLADRWIISQFSVGTTPFLQCVAVSRTGDPTGSYARYSYSYASFPDYPKLGVWPDAYYTTFNMFNASGTTFLGPQVCAYDRAKMIAAQAATQQCVTLSSTFGSLVPSDLDGPTAPPAGRPNYLLSFGTNALQVWKFHVDWTTPANTSMTGPTSLTTAAFSPACGGGACIPQSGTSNKLDSLADRLMYRLAYRNFGDHESLVVNHSVTAGSSVGLRWYELRNPNGNPTIFQQGTYAPDAAYRWMGSIAMDHAGNIGLGYSVSSSTTHPGIRYTGRLAGDALGAMTQGEGTVITGGGSQTGGLHRWGDYTSMSVDPSDDCTFWYTDEYVAANGSFNWHTRIGSFKFPNCSSGPSDFSISASPASLTIGQAGSATTTSSTSVTSGGPQAVDLSATGVPAGTTVGFSPASVSAGGSSTMTVNVGASTAPGPYTLTVTGTAASGSHSTTVALNVVASDFSISASPSSLGIAQGQSGTAMIGTAVLGGAAQTVSLSASGQPPGVTISFNPASVAAGGSSTMTASVAAATTPATYTITVTGTGSTGTHSSTVSLTVTPAPPSDFSISANPTSLTVAQGTVGTATIGTAVLSGSAQAVSLSASGQPTGTTVSFSPSSVTAGGASTMTVSVGAATATGDYTITVTGTGTTTTHTTTVSLTVTTAPQGVVNGGFETGTLSGWTASGAFLPRISTTAHTGGSSAQIGSASPVNGNSTLTQAVAIPAGSSRLTFWYQPHCTDTVTYDQIQAQIRSTSGTTLATALNVCPTGTAWTQVVFDTSAYAGQSVVLWFNDHDDGYAGDPTYFLLDDVAVASYTPTANVVQNGGFETGSLASWNATGAFLPRVSTTAHTGGASAQIGSASPVSGNSTLTQTVAVPGGSSTLSFWYQPHCTDTLTYDQIQMQIRNTSGATLATVLNVCPTTSVWTNVTFNTTAYAGQAVVLWFNDHDDGYAGDPTYFLVDDVTLN